MKTKNKETGVCSSPEVHLEAVERARRAMPLPEEVRSLACTFKILGDGTRLRILAALGTGEMCVCDLCETIGMSQSAISHQLGALRRARLVKCRRSGKNAFYGLDDEHVKELMKLGLVHIREERGLEGPAE